MHSERFKHFSIELDCPPGNPRPSDLITGVLQGTGLAVGDFDTGSTFFGHQAWVLKASAHKDATYAEARPVLKQRITALYNRGAIRHGSW